MPRLRALSARAAAPAAIACAVLAPLVIHWIAGRTLVWFDTQRCFAPQRWLVDEALRSFRLPLWNPYMGGGMPFFADAIHGVLHPLSVLTAWRGTGRSTDLLIGGYVACAGLGAALLARELGASRAGAAAAAFVYAMSGFVLSMAGLLTILAGAGSLPFCVAGLRRFASDGRAGGLALGAGGAAVLALSGDIQALMVGGALALALAFEAGAWRGALRATAAGTVGILVAGIQLVPSAVHVPRTMRAAEEWVARPSVWSLEPWRVVELALPGLARGADALMDPVVGALGGADGFPRGGLPIPYVQSVFVGLLPLALAAVGLREGRRGRLLGAVALVFLWVALGPALGASSVLGHVPLWRVFRYSEKLVGPLTLVLAVLAGLGLDAIVERRMAGWRFFAATALAGLAAVGIACLVVSGLAPEVAPDVAVDASGRVLRGAWHVLGATVAICGWLLVRDRIRESAGRAILVTLVWLGMAAATPMALRPGDPTSRLRSPGPQLGAPPPGPRIVTPYTYEPLSTEQGLDWIDQSGRGQAAKGYAAHNVRYRLDSLEDYAAMTPRRLARLRAAFGARWPAAARRYAATHVVVDLPRSQEHRTLHDAATLGGERLETVTGSHEVWSVPHRDWASFASQVVAVGDEEGARSATVRAIAEGSPAVVVEGWSRFEVGPGRVLSVQRGLESIRIEAEAAADATLVINDAWWAGWEATVDGVGTTIFRADALVRAVRWPAGRHVLEMHYRPPEVRTGIVTTILGLSTLVAWLAFLKRRARTTPPAPT